MRCLLLASCVGLLAAADLAPGLQLKEAGHLPEAEAVFRAAVTADASDVAALVQLATVVGWQDRHAEAEALWLRAAALRPSDPDVRLGLARVRWWRGDRIGAAQALDEALALAPQNAEALALQRRLRQEGRRLTWRGDALGGVESYSAVYGEATIVGAGLAASWRGLGTVSAGVQHRSFDQADETTWRAGLGVPLAAGVVIEAGGERTWDPFLAARAAISLDMSWRAAAMLEPVAGWRRSWYPGDRADLLRPGLRLYPLGGTWSASHAELRALIADSPVSGTHGGAALRLVAEHASGWAVSAGGAVADEAEPPRAVTRVVTGSLGVAWNGPAWGVRLDYEHEDRRADWLRQAVTLGVRCSW